MHNRQSLLATAAAEQTHAQIPRVHDVFKQGSHLAELEPRVVASWRDLMASRSIIN